jgi:hypothetical protein
MSIDMRLLPPEAGAKDSIAVKLAMTNSDYNGSYEVVIPEDIKKNAVVLDLTGLMGELPIPLN